MRIVLAGSSGFLGTELCRVLAADGHELTRLVRRRPSGADQVAWAPDRGELGPAALAGAGAVVNLAGANIGTHRWTERYKQLIRSSRVDSTATLARTIAALPATDRPAVLANASAIGWYGDTGDRPVTEEDPAGEGFFPDTCRVWEAATAPAERAGVRVLRLRIGLPLSANGGLLPPMLRQFKLFAGGRMGTGRQYLPWISLADWLDAVRFLLARDDLAGPVNLTGPAPARNAYFAATLGTILHRPSFWPIPRLALRVALGEFGGEALLSQRVLPGVLTSAGYRFQHPDLPGALEAALAPR